MGALADCTAGPRHVWKRGYQAVSNIQRHQTWKTSSIPGPRDGGKPSLQYLCSSQEKVREADTVMQPLQGTRTHL